MSRSLSLFLAVLFPITVLAASDQFKAPKPEELALKSVPFAPGASAVLLDYSQSQDDNIGAYTVYARIKIHLTVY